MPAGYPTNPTSSSGIHLFEIRLSGCCLFQKWVLQRALTFKFCIFRLLVPHIGKWIGGDRDNQRQCHVLTPKRTSLPMRWARGQFRPSKLEAKRHAPAFEWGTNSRSAPASKTALFQCTSLRKSRLHFTTADIPPPTAVTTRSTPDAEFDRFENPRSPRLTSPAALSTPVLQGQRPPEPSTVTIPNHGQDYRQTRAAWLGTSCAPRSPSPSRQSANSKALVTHARHHAIENNRAFALRCNVRTNHHITSHRARKNSTLQGISWSG